MTGTVTHVSDRGFAFITPDGDNDRRSRHFAHVLEMPGTVMLPEGTRVEFVSEMGDRGLRAVRINILADVPS